MVGIIFNPSAFNAQQNLNKANAGADAAIQRLSSGMRITKASDDVAGLAVGTQLQAKVSILKAASNNIQQANALLSVADGALANIGDMLQRMASLSSQASSAALDSTARGYLNQEFVALKDEIDRLASETNFNGIKLLDGTFFDSGITTEASTTRRTWADFVGKNLSLMVQDQDVLNVTKDDGTVITDLSGATNFSLGGAGVTGLFKNISIYYNSATDVDITMTVGADTYSLAAADLSSSGAKTLVESGAATAKITFTFADAINLNSQEDADALSAALTSILSTGNNYSISGGRDFSAVDGAKFNTLLSGDLTVNNESDVAVANLSGATMLSYTSGTIPTGQITDLNIDYDAVNDDLLIRMYIGGTKYEVDGVAANATTAALQDSSGNTVTLDFANALNISNQSDANFLAAKLADIFKSGNGTNSFQVGTAATDTIGVSINGSSTTDLSIDGNTIDTTDNAAAATTSVQTAINTVSSIRATIGSLMSRFDKAATSVATSIQNQDSARGVFLDTDISAESSNMAQQQVKMNASISVLAQANQLQQSLLKLLG